MGGRGPHFSQGEAHQVTLPTPHSSLSLDKGTQALEYVARLLEVPAGVFTDVE